MYENKNSTYLPGLYTNIVAYIHRDWFIEYQVLSDRSIISHFPIRTFVFLACLYVGWHPCGNVQRPEGGIRCFLQSLLYLIF